MQPSDKHSRFVVEEFLKLKNYVSWQSKCFVLLKAHFCIMERWELTLYSDRMPAKYIDPATQLPFYNKNAFKTIREAYYHYLEEKGSKTSPQVRTLSDA